MVTSFRSCPRCRFPLTALDRYCGACGFRASRMCPRCEHEVPNDLSFCSYCGQPMAPVETSEKLPRVEQVRLLYLKELEAFEDKVTELQARIRFARHRSMRKRGIELALFMVFLVIVVAWGAPFFEKQLNEVFSLSPARGILIPFLAAVLVVLAAAYFLQARQSTENAEIEELRSRLLLARERLEEVKSRYPEWSARDDQKQQHKPQEKSHDDEIDPGDRQSQPPPDIRKSEAEEQPQPHPPSSS